MGWTSGAVLGVLAASLVVLGSFVGWEAHSSHPMLKAQSLLESPVLNRRARRNTRTFDSSARCLSKRSFLQFDLGYSPLQAGLRILQSPPRWVLVAVFSPFFVRLIGVKFTVAAGLASIAGGLWQVSTVSTVTTTYGQVVPGCCCSVSAPASLLPTATNSVVARSLREIPGYGSASNAVALQVGGALGVAVIGKHTGDAAIQKSAHRGAPRPSRFIDSTKRDPGILRRRTRRSAERRR